MKKDREKIMENSRKVEILEIILAEFVINENRGFNYTMRGLCCYSALCIMFEKINQYEQKWFLNRIIKNHTKGSESTWAWTKINPEGYDKRMEFMEKMIEKFKK